MSLNSNIKMEPDSTTYESPSVKADRINLPFITNHSNLALYEEFLCNNNSEKAIERQLVEKLQGFGLLPKSIKCMNKTPECNVVCRAARVIDRLQWACESCGKRQPIREGSFFLRLQCSLTQALQMILAWCEDADLNVAAEFFGVKVKVATQIYDKLDELAAKEYNKAVLGGSDSVVLAEIFPDCLNSRSPDTTEQPHVHRILMLADTKHIPTYYHLHVLKDDMRKNSSSYSINSLKSQIEYVIGKAVAPDSTVVIGNTVPAIEGAVPIQQVTQHCDADMQHFLTSRIWKQATGLCAASRDLCANVPLPVICASSVQRYLDAATASTNTSYELLQKNSPSTVSNYGSDTNIKF